MRFRKDAGLDEPRGQSATAAVIKESWTHGSSHQRQEWFTVGYGSGNANRCDAFASDTL